MHFVKLDGLRGLSILMVIAGHWLMLSKFYIANIGVEIFFVLSGFLITLILLKNKSETNGTDVSSVLKKFYIRRFLRIFPIYYLVLFICYTYSYPNATIRQHFTWDILYLNNVYAWLYNLKLKNFVHLWSLSVEEQFYLIWPWVILLTPHKFLKKILIGTIFTGIAFRFFYYSPITTLGIDFPMGTTLLPACFDLFAAGGLLAYYFKYHPQNVTNHAQYSIYFFLAGLLIMIISKLSNNNLFFQTSFRIGSSISAVSLILICLKSSPSIMDVIFNNPALIYIGRISYGLYLFHLLYVDEPFVQVYSQIAGHEPRFMWILISRFCLLIIIGSVSWYFFERPINNLKDKLAAY
ncbi:MAG: acyltransferase [Chitinophagales bacterium]